MFEGLRGEAVHRINLDESEITFVVFGNAHFAFDRIPGVKIKAPDLRGRDVDVVCRSEVARVGTAEKTETVGQDFKRPVAENLFARFGALFKDGEHQFLLAHALSVVDFKLRSHVQKLADVKSFKLGKMHFAAEREKPASEPAKKGD